MASEPAADLYISGDVEADGPIPGSYSMLSFGLCVAGRFDGDQLQSFHPKESTFYAELQPIAEKWDPEALKVAHLDRERLRQEGQDPRKAMTEAAKWVRLVSGEDRPVFVGFPAPFDWMFLYWYFVQFANGGSPFEFSAVLDMKTIFQQKGRRVTGSTGLNDLPPALRPDSPHTHNALDDAISQAEIFVRLFHWDGKSAPT